MISNIIFLGGFIFTDRQYFHTSTESSQVHLRDCMGYVLGCLSDLSFDIGTDMSNADFCAEPLGASVVWVCVFQDVITPLLSVPLLCSISAIFMFFVSRSCLSLLPSQSILYRFMACVEIAGKGELLSVGVICLLLV